MVHNIILIVGTLGIVAFVMLGWQWGMDSCYHKGANLADVGIIHLTGIVSGLLSGLLIIEIGRD